MVYIYAGLVKINPDWLRLEPLGMWLSRQDDWPRAGPEPRIYGKHSVGRYQHEQKRNQYHEVEVVQITRLLQPEVTFESKMTAAFVPKAKSGFLPLTPIGPMHIHEEVVGANGPVVVPFSQLAFYTATATGFTV